jgi:hypothetical protein
MGVFQAKAEELFPYLLQYSPEQAQEHRELIKNSMEMIAKQFFVQRCIAILLPEIKDEILKGIKQDLATEINEIPVEALGYFPFPSLSSRVEQEGQSQFRQSVLIIHPDLATSQEFTELVEELRATISAHVKDIEIAKLKQYGKYIQEERKREKAEREAQFKEDLTKMEREEAQKRQQLEEERNAAKRLQKEEEGRYRMEQQEKQALLVRQSVQKEEYEAQMLAMKQLIDHQQKELVHAMMEEIREEKARAEARRQEDERLHAERETNLQLKIKQLQLQQPPIRGDMGKCNVS